MSDENAGAGQGQQQEQQGVAGQAAGQGAQQQAGQGQQQQGAGQGAQGAAQQQGQAEGQGAAGTVAGGQGGEGRPAPTDFPENWRAQMAGDDKDIDALLGRYKSPKDVGAALKNMRAELSKRSAGAKLEAPGEDATPEQWADFRKAAGIPEKAEDYGNALALPEGMVLGEADKPIAASFFEAAHKANLPQPVVNAALKWYFEHAERQEIARQNADEAAYDETAAALREEWGAADFRRNINALTAVVQPFFGKYGEDLFDRLLLARMPDGRKVGDDAGMVKAMVDLALELNPTARTTPADTASAMRSTESRIAEIEAMMKDPVKSKEYYANEGLQKEYRDALSAREKLSARRAA